MSQVLAASTLDGLNNAFLSKVIGTLVNNLGNISEGAQEHVDSHGQTLDFLKRKPTILVIPKLGVTLTCSLSSRLLNNSNPWLFHPRNPKGIHRMTEYSPVKKEKERLTHGRVNIILKSSYSGLIYLKF